MILPLGVHAATHVGLVHETNEDSHAVVETEEGGLLLLVCDGMGGMGHGDEASALAIQLLSDHLRTGGGYPPQRMRHALRQADIELREHLCAGDRGMPGSTAVMVYILDGVGHVAWVGDSRAYLIRDGAVFERTSDHKLINELMATGQLSEEEAKGSHLSHIVTRALGGRAPGEKAVTGATLGHPWKLRNGDVVVLCSDGVCDLVEDDELPTLVTNMAPEEATDALIRVALERGGHDNITCIVARWEGPDFVEDDASTPIMTPREEEPLDDSALQGVIDTLDERLGAERATEEISFEETPAGVTTSARATLDDETEEEPPTAPPPQPAPKHPAPKQPEPTFEPQDQSRAWLVVLLALAALVLAVLFVLAGG